jgi:hypothetical protein
MTTDTESDTRVLVCPQTGERLPITLDSLAAWLDYLWKRECGWLREDEPTYFETIEIPIRYDGKE